MSLRLLLILCSLFLIGCNRTGSTNGQPLRPITIAQIKDQDSLFDFVKKKGDSDDLIKAALDQYNTLGTPFTAAELRSRLLKNTTSISPINEDFRPGIFLIDLILQNIDIEDFKKDGCPALADSKKPDPKALGILLSATAFDPKNRTKVKLCLIDEDWLRAFGEWAGRNYLLAAQGYFKEVYQEIADLNKKATLRNIFLQAMTLEIGRVACEFLKNNALRYGLEANDQFAIEFEGENLDGELGEIYNTINNATENSDWHKALLADAGVLFAKVDAQNINIERTPIFGGVAGLQNCGNTCFMNSVIQATFQTPSLNRLLDGTLAQAPFKNSVLNREDTFFAVLQKTFQDYKEASLAKAAASTQLIADSRAEFFPMFERGQQADAGEFYNEMLERLNKEFLISAGEAAEDIVLEVNNKPYLRDNFDIQKNKDILKHGYSVINKWFQFYLKSEVETNIKGLNSKTIKFESANLLSLSMTNQIDPIGLKTLLDDFFKVEILSEGALNLGTKKFGGKKTLSLQTAPQYLRISLNRFHNARHKVSTPIDFTAKLALNTVNGPVNYRLYAISCHYGALGGGHYWGNVKTSDGNWYKVNDSNVTPKSEDEVIKDEKENVYLLFYARQ